MNEKQGDSTGSGQCPWRGRADKTHGYDLVETATVLVEESVRRLLKWQKKESSFGDLGSKDGAVCSEGRGRGHHRKMRISLTEGTKKRARRKYGRCKPQQKHR